MFLSQLESSLNSNLQLDFNNSDNLEIKEEATKDLERTRKQ